MSSTLAEYLASQEELVQEAALALPHQFSQCSYPLGALRQAVYLCLSCPEARGLCSACSIACHTDHDQIELFPKRNFRCDCPTAGVAHPCSLHKTLEAENTSNVYGHNFKGLFCRCGRSYDPKTERETMIQCLACEDWFHESCCNLRERPSSPDLSEEQIPEETGGTQENQDDGVSEASSSDLPLPLIPGSEYEAFICGACASKNETLIRWAGTPGITIVVRDNPDSPWKCLGDNDRPSNELVDVEGTPSLSTAGTKRPLSPSDAPVPEAKRVRGISTTPASGACLAPKSNSIAQTIFANIRAPAECSLGSGDLFLSENFRERWCHCTLCLPPLTRDSYLLEEEETYEPPEDPDSGLSLEELGMRALERLPRDRAIDGIHAFNGMRDDLVKYLRPFAQEGKVVNETDVREFFAALTEAAKKGRK